MAKTDTSTLTIYGDTLEIRWNGSMWQAPATGEQFLGAAQAMRREVEMYMQASGENLDDADVQETIDDLMSDYDA